MRRFILIFAMSFVLAAQARAEEVLYCTEKDANGFSWKPGQSDRTAFKPERFIVKILTEKTRMVKLPRSASEPYDCYKSVQGHLICSARFFPTEPIMFKGDRFTRASLYSRHLGGDLNLFVAYGTCTKF